MITKGELERYDRQIMIADIGEEGQEKLKRTRVFIAGTGGLGSSAAIYLTVAGVGMIRVVDHDCVELSNLNRQILHWDEDVGKKKAASATEKLKKINREVKIEAIEETITDANVFQLIAGFDVIVDAMDNLPTRYLLNKAAIEKN
ncbi:MAG: HesA/MoeB/ThiF family protein, partial [Proteobacteria bacterium]|nr:HesA/MoeB/ThiF family protein [Pseudomonadota bacterium]